MPTMGWAGTTERDPREGAPPKATTWPVGVVSHPPPAAREAAPTYCSEADAGVAALVIAIVPPAETTVPARATRTVERANLDALRFHQLRPADCMVDGSTPVRERLRDHGWGFSSFGEITFCPN